MKFFFEVMEAGSVSGEEFCFPLDWLQDRLREGETEIRLQEAKSDVNGPGMWCAREGEAFERGSNDCGRQCPGYAPRNRKGGICKEQTFCRIPVGPVLILTVNGLRKE